MEPITSNDFLNSVLETEAWKEVSQCGSQSSGLPSVECNGRSSRQASDPRSHRHRIKISGTQIDCVAA